MTESAAAARDGALPSALLSRYPQAVNWLKNAWLQWTIRPDWAELNRLAGFAVLLLFFQGALVFAEILVPAEQFHESYNSFLPLLLAGILILILQTLATMLAWKLRGKVGSLESTKAPDLPTIGSLPPSDQWSRLATARGRDRRSMLLYLVGIPAVTALLVPVPYLQLLAPSSDLISVIFTTWSVVGFIAIIFLTVLARLRMGPTLLRLGRDEYLNAARSVVSPALEKSIELNRLASELKDRSATAERIVAEVDALFEELNEATEARQQELTQLLREVEAGQSLQDLTQSQRDGLLALFGQESKVREQRNLRINIALALLSTIAGYALSLVYPAESLRAALLR